jgi:glycosyltransferase involved in cell wall biosynthesis
MPFSVLMSIYHATEADELAGCLKSLVNQELTSDQIVLVRDGPVQPAVEQCIEKYALKLPFEHVVSGEHRGLGWALHDGLAACAYEIVARADSDDYSMPERFALQTEYLDQNLDISAVGGWMKEYYPLGDKLSPVVRKTPSDTAVIPQYARRRNPVNHPTVMFRKSHVIGSGGYQPCMLFEDYFLWARMLVAGYLLSNISKVLVETQVGKEYFSRRGGINYLRHELSLLRLLRNMKFITRVESAAFVLTRLPMRLAPLELRKYLYRKLLRGQ